MRKQQEGFRPAKYFSIDRVAPEWYIHSRWWAHSKLQEGFRPAKYFSIDRVFRNEAIDRTHLAEFHQIEGGCGKLQRLELNLRTAGMTGRTHAAESH